MNKRNVVRNLPNGLKTLSRRFDGQKYAAAACVYREVTASPKDIRILRDLASGKSVSVF